MCSVIPTETFGIALQAYCLSAQQERQYVWSILDRPDGINTLTNFAHNNPGKLYFLGDEPDLDIANRGVIPPSIYAQKYHNLVITISSVDQTARFAPAGTGSMVYMENFLTSYRQQFGISPRIDEWHFHHFAIQSNLVNLQPWKDKVNEFATWSINHGAPMVLSSTGLPGVIENPNLPNQIADVTRQMLQAVYNDTRIITIVWWPYNIFPGDAINYPLVTKVSESNFTLTSEGIVFREFVYAPFVKNSIIFYPSRHHPISGDYDGDGKTDFAVWRIETGEWFIKYANGNIRPVVRLGRGVFPENDRPVPGDYDGDGKTDFAVWGPSTGKWFIIYANGSNAPLVGLGLGIEPYYDRPVPADYDGDHKTDYAVFRPGTGQWFIRYATGYSPSVVGYGNGLEPYLDQAVPADYDGDGRADIAVYRRSTGEWFIRYATGTYASPIVFGSYTYYDRPVPADYDGDGKTDMAVYRPGRGEWHIRYANGSISIIPFGASGAPYFDRAIPGDYDGDHKADQAVFRPLTGEWWIKYSSGLNKPMETWGALHSTFSP